jgi:hypothetical protein
MEQDSGGRTIRVTPEQDGPRVPVMQPTPGTLVMTPATVTHRCGPNCGRRS